MPEDDASEPLDVPLAGDAFEEPGLHTFEVAAGEAGERLDAYLAARINEWSRARLQRLIEDGDVLVAGRERKPSYKLRAGDTVEVELTAAPAPFHLAPEDIPLDIIYEDADLVVVNKPAGMVVHPAAGVSSGTLANALAFRFRNAEFGLRIDDESDAPRDEMSDGSNNPSTTATNSVDETDIHQPDHSNPHSAFRNPQSAIPQSVRPGIVHRLDRDTSGLVVVAKNEWTHEKLSEQFREREVFKSYVALVHGVVSREAQAAHRVGQAAGVSGRIEQPMGRDPRQRTRMAVVRGGRTALTLYRVRRWFHRFTLLDVEIKTGRTHQIRVHMAWFKHPVVGDAVYGAGRDANVPEGRVRALIAALGRQFLHAEQLGFRHPRTGEALRFTAPLPPELSEFLASLET
jgi:23S rRNA pseudouridine1911/1915/1917 synthase